MDRVVEATDYGETLAQCLRAGENVGQRWFAPKGRAVLTDLRLIVLGHPHPVHRVVNWECNLEAIQSLDVTEIENDRVSDDFARQSLAGSSPMFRTPQSGPLDPQFSVMVDGIAVYTGTADKAADIQKWIDDARCARQLQVYGKLLPFQPKKAGE